MHTLKLVKLSNFNEFIVFLLVIVSVNTFYVFILDMSCILENP